MSACLAKKRVAERTIEPTRVKFACGKVKAEIEELVSAGVLRRIGNQVVYLDEVIGEDLDDAVVYLKNKKNSGTLTILRVKLKEAIV